jgi:CheY-like chemotaxis protein
MLFKTLLGHNRHVTLAAVTGWSAQEDRDKAREAGFDHHLTKPVSFESLLDLIAKIKLDE